MVLKPQHWWQRLWRPGRQGTGYRKMSWTCRWFDCHVIHYPTGSYLNAHTDPVDGYEHHRVNCVIKRARSGGEFLFCQSESVDWKMPNQRIIKFRPDINPHQVKPVKSGSRIVLSVGWAKKNPTTKR